jgi:hypothetical protein
MNSAQWRSPACRRRQFTYDGFHGELRIGAAATLRPSSGHRRAVRAILSLATATLPDAETMAAWSWWQPAAWTGAATQAAV